MDQAVCKGPIHFATFVPPVIKIFRFENRDDEAGETAHQVKPLVATPGIDPQDPCCGKREPTLANCLLIATSVLCLPNK